MALVPDKWKADGIKSTDFKGIEENEVLLQEITRAVPLKLLLDHKAGSLAAASDKSALTSSHFFLSTPVKTLGAFISHRWSADPTSTVYALIIHVWFTGAVSCLGMPPVLALVLLILAFAFVCIILYPPFVIPVVPLFAFFLNVIFYLTARSGGLLTCLGYGKARYWYDKSTVHQTTNTLTQAGLHIFSHYLKKSEALVILFQPEYLTRVWCVYELAWWLSQKKEKGISFVPINTYNTLARVLASVFPKAIAMICIVVALLLTWGLTCIKLVQIALPESIILIGLGVLFLGVLCITACIGACFAKMIINPAKKERLAVAAQFRAFEVRDTVAFNPSDRDFVLKQICHWWSSQGKGDEAALDAFNAYMRTTVGPKLGELQRRRERVIIIIILAICFSIDVYIFVFITILCEWPGGPTDTFEAPRCRCDACASAAVLLPLCLRLPC